MKKLLACAAALLAFAAPALASEIPGTDIPYATYRQQLINNGWRPDPSAPCCGPFKETSTGNRVGTGHWFHPADGKQIEVTIWPCRHGWCVAPAFSMLGN
jgi:hypothetical protein